MGMLHSRRVAESVKAAIIVRIMRVSMMVIERIDIL